MDCTRPLVKQKNDLYLHKQSGSHQSHSSPGRAIVSIHTQWCGFGAKRSEDTESNLHYVLAHEVAEGIG